MKRIFIYGIALILLLGLIDASNGFIKDEKEVALMEAETLIKGFEASEADFVEVNINTTLHLPNEFFTMTRMEEIKEGIIEKLNLKGDVMVVTNQEHYDPYFASEEYLDKEVIYIYVNEEKGYNQITATAVDPNGKITVLILYSTDIENEKESYIIIDMVQNKGYKDIGETIVQHKGILENYGNRIETNTALIGTISGALSGKNKRKWLDIVAKAVDAKKVEETTDDAYVSITLFTKNISRAIQYGNKKVNLQLASRYNQYEDKTYLWIASPLITDTY